MWQLLAIDVDGQLGVTNGASLEALDELGDQASLPVTAGTEALSLGNGHCAAVPKPDAL